MPFASADPPGAARAANSHKRITIAETRNAVRPGSVAQFMQTLIPRALKLAAFAAIVLTFFWQIAQGICPVP